MSEPWTGGRLTFAAAAVHAPTTVVPCELTAPFAPRDESSDPLPMQVIDYNGDGRWSREAILARYGRYAAEMSVSPRDLSPREHTDGRRCWVYPVMDQVIAGIDAGDRACIQLGVEFIEEDATFPFGRVLKSNTARALRRAPLSEAQKHRIRRRVFGLLEAGRIAREYREYAKLVRKIGFKAADVPPVDPLNPHAVRFGAYFEAAARQDDGAQA